jgi:hypothetical protein
MTAKEYLISRFPDIQITWNETGHDDSFTELMMEAYAYEEIELHLKQERKKPLYAFLYNPMIHESGYITVSIHRTREGAEKALEWHKNECREEWKTLYEAIHKKEWVESDIYMINRNWKIEEIKILD